VAGGASDSRFCGLIGRVPGKRVSTGNGKTGRPISFDRDAALEAAMLLFWERGYEGTSMADLTQAMGLNPSSIYAAFGGPNCLLDRNIGIEPRRPIYVTDIDAQPFQAVRGKSLDELRSRVEPYKRAVRAN
jgi:hypothetical protein